MSQAPVMDSFQRHSLFIATLCIAWDTKTDSAFSLLFTRTSMLKQLKARIIWRYLVAIAIKLSTWWVANHFYGLVSPASRASIKISSLSKLFYFPFIRSQSDILFVVNIKILSRPVIIKAGRFEICSIVVVLASSKQLPTAQLTCFHYENNSCLL